MFEDQFSDLLSFPNFFLLTRISNNTNNFPRYTDLRYAFPEVIRARIFGQI